MLSIWTGLKFCHVVKVNSLLKKFGLIISMVALLEKTLLLSLTKIWIDHFYGSLILENIAS